jgi:hypothetical protein
MDRSALAKVPTPQIETEVKALRKGDMEQRLLAFDDWQKLGIRLAELRDRHFHGKLGSGTWAAYCRKLGFSRTDADFYIAAADADDPAEFLKRVFTLQEQREARKPDSEERRRTIFIKRPGVIWGYIHDLDPPAKRELYAMIWRFDGKALRKVGDELGGDYEDDEARPTM